MNEMTVYLAKIFGPILILVGLSLGFKRRFYVDWLKNMEKSEALLFVSSVGEVAVGLGVLLNHFLWGSLAEVLVTLLGCVFVLEGAVILLTDLKTLRHFLVRHVGTKAWSWVVMGFLLLGIYLGWVGYFLV